MKKLINLFISCVVAYGTACAMNNELPQLHLAARDGNVEFIVTLHPSQAQVNQQYFGLAPLHYAAANGHQAVAQALIDAGADVDKQNRFLETPLHYTASRGHQATAQTLIKAGATVNKKDENGETPLHMAILYDHKTVIETLLEAGADVSIQNKLGWAPLHFAASTGDPAVVKALIAAGANVNQQTNEGETALLFAKTPVIAQILIDSHAHINQKASHSRTPLTNAKLMISNYTRVANVSSPLINRPNVNQQYIRDLNSECETVIRNYQGIFNIITDHLAQNEKLARNEILSLLGALHLRLGANSLWGNVPQWIFRDIFELLKTCER